MLSPLETSAFIAAVTDGAGMEKDPAAATPGIVARHEAGTSDVLIPGGSLTQVVFDALTLCNSSHDIHCGLTIVPASRAPETVAASDDVPVRVDWLQQELRQGPGLDAHHSEVLAIQDLAADERWADFGKMCVAVLNLRSMVSIRIPLTTSDRASLNFYSSEPTAFEHLEVGPALRLARLAAPRIKELISEFRRPLLGAARSNYSRVAIAVGTVMARHRVNSSDAFDLLSAASYDLGRALLDVAIETAVNGRLPEEAIIGARVRHRINNGTSQEQRHAAASPRIRRRVSVPAAGGGQRKVREPVHDGRPSVGGPGMWHDPARR